MAPILEQRRLMCHREGEMAPFPLNTYEEVIAWADTIKEVIDQHRMPPWHANPKYGLFANDAQLPDNERQVIDRWIIEGLAEGNPTGPTKPSSLQTGWNIQEPDLVVSM